MCTNGSAQFQNMSSHFPAFLMLVGLHSHYDSDFEKIVYFFVLFLKVTHSALLCARLIFQLWEAQHLFIRATSD